MNPTKRRKEKTKPNRVAANAIGSAKSARLVHVTDASPGIRRLGKGPRFRYVLPSGKPVTDLDTLIRIRSLVIPPAWKDVWICTKSNGHLQATGRDARGRKQSRYHARWREVRDQSKYDKMLDFAEALPAIRRATARHLRLPGLPREKVLATCVQLLEKTLIRIGNTEYAKSNQSFGLTTIRNRHVHVRGSNIRFEFRGKSGVDHGIDLDNPRLAKVIRRCQDLPGQELFEYIDDAGRHVDVTSQDVNDYLHDITGKDFTAKDFRTWHGTVLAAAALAAFEKADSQAEAKRNVVKAVTAVAERLGNTKAVCRRCYIHPAVISAYGNHTLQVSNKSRKSVRGLNGDEHAVVALLSRVT